MQPGAALSLRLWLCLGLLHGSPGRTASGSRSSSVNHFPIDPRPTPHLGAHFPTPCVCSGGWSPEVPQRALPTGVYLLRAEIEDSGHPTPAPNSQHPTLALSQVIRGARLILESATLDRSKSP
ncbi:hypothetical protein ACRRTK_006645 [Alexandromys fortis]